MRKHPEIRIPLGSSVTNVRLLAVREPNARTEGTSPRQLESKHSSATHTSSPGEASLASTTSLPESAGHGADLAQPVLSSRDAPSLELSEDRTPALALEVMQSLSEQLTELEVRRQTSLTELQQLAVELATAMTGQLLRKEILAGQYPFESLVTEALMRLDAQQMAVIRLHPDDLAVLQASGDLTKRFASTLRWVGDSTMERGGCLVEAADLGLLTTWQHRLEAMHQSLLESLEHAEIERRGTRETPEGMRRFPERRETA